MRTILMAVLAAATALPAIAQDFSEGSEARSWNLYAERPARFEARVVDPLCALAGECTAECAPGRQYALERSADGVLVMPLKNNQPIFSGAAADLEPYCGAAVEVDGLMIEDPELGATNVYLVQRIRRLDGGEWAPATRFTEAWAAANPEAAAGDGAWFRRDPRVQAEIAGKGWLGLGPEAEEAFLRDWLGVE